MQQPKNRQEFLALQARAAAEARDMQRRATLPVPGQESGRREQGSGGRRQEPAGYTPFKPYQPPKPEPAPPPPKPKPPPPSAPPLSDLFKLFGNFGGGSAANKQPPPDDAPPGDGMDSLLPMLLMLLLKKENADQGLLMALMYILM